MIKIISFVVSVLLTGCLGYSSKNNEMVGQIKRVTFETPILCPNFSAVDISMGILQNGSGSMSKEDMWLYVEDKELPKIKEMAAKGSIVKVVYDISRLTFCVPDHYLRLIEKVQ